jgi:hypothetical protein
VEKAENISTKLLPRPVRAEELRGIAATVGWKLFSLHWKRRSKPPLTFLILKWLA